MSYTTTSTLVFFIVLLMTMATMFDPELNNYRSKGAWAIAIGAAVMTAWGVSSL